MAKRKKKVPGVSTKPATSPAETSGRQGVVVNIWIRKRIADRLRAFLDSQGMLAPTKTAVIEAALDLFLESKGFPDSDDS